MLSDADLRDVPRDVFDALQSMAQSLTPSDLRQTIQKLGLYKRGDSAPPTVAEVQLCAPAAADVDTDAILDAVSDGQTHRVATLLQEVLSQGTAPTTLCIMAMRHFRQLHTVASDPGGAGQGIGKLRPPVFGPRRDRLMRQASRWGRPRLEQALAVLMDTDLTLRSASRAPQAATLERALIRLGMMAARQTGRGCREERPTPDRDPPESAAFKAPDERGARVPVVRGRPTDKEKGPTPWGRPFLRKMRSKT